MIAVVVDEVLGVVFELLFLVGAALQHEREEPAALVLFHPPPQRAVLDRLVADEVNLADADLRPLVDVEGDVHQLRAALDFLDLGLDLRELVPSDA